MRIALARLGAAYVVAAGLFGGVTLIGTGSNAGDVPGTDAAIRNWFERLEMRMNPPPESFTIAIAPWEAPLRRLKPDEDILPDEPNVAPSIPGPREIVPRSPFSPRITRYADAGGPESAMVARDFPLQEPVAEIAPIRVSMNFASVKRMRSVRIGRAPRLSGSAVVAEPQVRLKAVRSKGANSKLARTKAGNRKLATQRTVAPKAVADVANKEVAPKAVAPVTQPEPAVPVVHVAERLHDRLSNDLLSHFDLFLYISKSIDGPLAQHMYVFTKDRHEEKTAGLKLLYDWPVSTGRELVETDNNGMRTSTATPAGFYQLDPKRFYRRYTSSQWGRPMPNSMFFDWMVGGYRTGLAIHGVVGDEEIAALGMRYSSGCVHLSPEDAQSLFEMIKHDYRGPVPAFAYDPKTKTIANNGKLARDGKGTLRMGEGYKALVVIENYGGQDMITGLNMDSPPPEG